MEDSNALVRQLKERADALALAEADRLEEL